MSKFYCSLCKYTSGNKHHVKDHINKKKFNKCEGAEIMSERYIIRCGNCKKKFNSDYSLTRHKKTSCKGIPKKPNEISKKPKKPNEIPNEFFYIIQERESVRMNEPVYKIGRTSKSFQTRFKQYPEGSRAYFVYAVPDSIDTETKIIDRFNEKFKLIRGREYFEGPIHELIEEAMNICIAV